MKDDKNNLIYLPKENDEIIDSDILRYHTKKTQFNENTYDLIGIHISGGPGMNVACLFTLSKLLWMN